MATTPTLVREALAAAILALVPATLPTDPFQRYRLERPFEEWAGKGNSVAHCFRWFELRFEQPAESPLVVNGAEGRWRYAFTLTVAYPRSHYKTITTPVLDLDTAIDEDMALLVPVLRDCVLAAYVAEDAEFERETVDAVTFLRFTAPYELWRIV